MSNEVTITPLGIALGLAVEMGIVSKDDPDVLAKFKQYWEQVEKYVLPYAFGGENRCLKVLTESLSKT